MRPALHLTAPRGWINDPHGVTFHAGQYHLFHQYVPDSTSWEAHCHWGHATSPDLMTWTHHGIAIAPDHVVDVHPGGSAQEIGVWSGCLVQDRDHARIFYTSVSSGDLALGRVRSARPKDPTWTSWTKGPVVIEPPGSLDLIAFRDPFVLREASRWRMFVGASDREGTALVPTWTSTDLDTWTYDGIALARSTRAHGVWTGSLWECPQFFDIDGHWVMVMSVWDAGELAYAAYAVGGQGSYSDGRFHPADWRRLSFGGSYYAPSFFRDEQGRPCLILWMREVSNLDEGWASCLSVPYLLSVEQDALVAEPHPALETRRTRRLGPGEPATRFDTEWHPTQTGDEIIFFAGSSESARLTLGADHLALARPGRDSWSLPWVPGPIRVIIDGPVIEVSTVAGMVGAGITPTTSYQSPQEVIAWAL